MSRIAVIADIHGNLPALESVLDDIADASIDEVLVNGDLVGRGPQGSAVVHRIRELGVACTRGNHEDYALQFRRAEVPPDWLTLPEWACARWIAAELDDPAIAYLDERPMTLVSSLEPQLRLFHGSPTSYNEGLGAWTPEDELRAHIDRIDESVLVVAHTHRPLVWQTEFGTIVNVGSVGLPFNGDWRAQYAIFDGTGHDFTIELRRVDYDRDALLHHYDSSGFLESGDATSHLLRKEVETARPHLVPFLKWAEATQRAPALAYVPQFLDIYDPVNSMEEFAAKFGLK